MPERSAPTPNSTPASSAKCSTAAFSSPHRNSRPPSSPPPTPPKTSTAPLPSLKRPWAKSRAEVRREGAFSFVAAQHAAPEKDLTQRAQRSDTERTEKIGTGAACCAATREVDTSPSVQEQSGEGQHYAEGAHQHSRKPEGAAPGQQRDRKNPQPHFQQRFAAVKSIRAPASHVALVLQLFRFLADVFFIV